MRRWLLRLAGVAAVVLVAIIAIHHGSSYRVRMLLSNANGLRDGSQVKVGGVPVGSVAHLGLGHDDQVIAELKLNHGYHVTKAGSAAIVPVDLLGSMYVQLTPGHGAAEPSGSTLPASRVTYPVELDQVLDVLDAQTRVRLGILIDETGTALTGRGADFNQVLGMLPNTFSDGSRLLGQLVSDNHTLADLAQHSNRFVSALIPQQRQLTALIHTAGQTMSVTAGRQADLRAILGRAPQTLDTAQRFLADLRTTAEPLKPAAEAISATAPELSKTLAAVPAFQRSADPTLDTAVRAAPELTDLADQATPVVKDALPTLDELSSFASTSSPTTYALSESIDNALGLIEGWAKAIQAGDGIGHEFHGRALVSEDLVQSLASSLGASSSSSSSTASQRHASASHTGTSSAGQTGSTSSLGSTVKGGDSGVASQVGGVVTTITKTLNGVTGQVSKGVSGTTQQLGLGSNGSGSNTTTTSSSGLASLLNYLLKP